MRLPLLAWVLVLAVLSAVSLAAGARLHASRLHAGAAPLPPAAITEGHHTGTVQYVPIPIPPNKPAPGGQGMDNGRQGGPPQSGIDPMPSWSTVTEEAAQYMTEGYGAAGWQPLMELYDPAVATLQINLLPLFPSTARQQGQCNSCWALVAAEHMQAALARAGQIEGPFPFMTLAPYSPMNASLPLYRKVSVQQIISCLYPHDDFPKTCKGGSVLQALRFYHDVGIVPMEAYAAEDGWPNAARCQPYTELLSASNFGTIYPTPFYHPGPNVAYFITAPCLDVVCPASMDAEKQAAEWMRQSGLPLIAYVDASNWSTFGGGWVFPASNCSSSGSGTIDQSHVVQLVGVGTDTATNAPFWLVRNSWGAAWAEAGHIRLEFGANACGVMNYLVQIDANLPQPTYPLQPNSEQTHSSKQE